MNKKSHSGWLMLVIVFFLVDSRTAVSQSKFEGESGSKNQKSNFEISGNIIGGVEYFDEFYDANGESSNEAFLRRAKIGFDYSLNEDWKVEVELTLKEKEKKADFELGDGYVSYQGFDLGEIKFGHMKEPFGFERLTGLSKIHVNERSLTTSSLAPGRNYGIQISENRKSWTWAFGYFKDDEYSSSPANITARVSHAVIMNKSQVLHLGGSVSVRDLEGAEFQVKENAGLFIADNIVRSAKFNAEKAELSGLEIFWQYDSLSLTGEYIRKSVQQTGGDEWDYSGYYIQSSYFLGGNKVPYKKGKLKSVKPNASNGAWELVARYNETNLRDNGLGSETRIALAGINYYYQEHTILKLNYYRSTIEGNSLSSANEGNAISARVVFRY